MERKFVNKKWIFYIGCLISALVPLALCSKSSPLYPFNDWPDVNIFFTLGKGMMHGKVPYVDLLDHKGPYMYAVAGVAYLLCHKGFLGFFWIELISMVCFVIYSCKTIGLYSRYTAIWTMPFLCAAVVSAKSFVHGGSLEELCLGIFAYAIYTLLRFLRSEDHKMPAKTVFINGILAGLLLWSKFTLLGLYIAWMIVLVLTCLCRKNIRDAVKNAGIFAGAVILTTIPWLIYFGYHHAVGDWMQIYIINNIFGYTSGEEQSLLQKIQIAVLNALRSLKDVGNRQYSLLLMAGCAVYVLFPKKLVSLAEKAAVAFMGFGMSLGIFIGGTHHDYYGLPLAVFAVFGILIPVMAVGYLTERLKLEKFRIGIYAGLWGSLLVAGTVGAYFLSDNTYLLGTHREEMPQYRFAQEIEESQDRSLLNYGFLDGGVFTVLGDVPTVKYYFRLNWNPDKMIEEQNRYLENQATNWVVTWKAFEVSEEELQTLPEVSEHYELVDYQYFYFEGDMRTYALYRKR